MRDYAVVLFVCLVSALTTSLAAGEYRLAVRLQEFSSPDGNPIELGRIVSDPKGLRTLTAGRLLFLHQTNARTGGVIDEEITVGETEAKVSYRMGEEKGDTVSVTVAVTVTEVLEVRNDIPITSTTSASNVLRCPIGEEIVLGGAGRDGSKQLRLFTIKITR